MQVTLTRFGRDAFKATLPRTDRSEVLSPTQKFERFHEQASSICSLEQHATMSATMFEAPYTIATLPKPLDAIHGRTQSAPVYGIRDLKKRKRHEVVVGVDGESVNIYNVQTTGTAHRVTMADRTHRSRAKDSSHPTPCRRRHIYVVRHVRSMFVGWELHRHVGVYTWL